MIELSEDSLVIRFPAIEGALEEIGRRWLHSRIEHWQLRSLARYLNRDQLFAERFAKLIVPVTASVDFQRTLRIPDDGKHYRLPPGFGRFPVRHVDDFPVPEHWRRRGGVMLPMHNSEAMWINFRGAYPMALRIAAGGVCAVSGIRWTAQLCDEPQNYVVLPHQPWLDGFRIDPNTVRQFVAVPLGSGLTVEGQITGEETWGGLQIQAYPLRAEEFWETRLRHRFELSWDALVRQEDSEPRLSAACARSYSRELDAGEMGMGAGGRITQEITKDPYGYQAWDTTQIGRCYVHLCSAGDWSTLTGAPPPTRPPTVESYEKAGLPWFSYYSDQPPIKSQSALKHVKSIETLEKLKARSYEIL